MRVRCVFLSRNRVPSSYGGCSPRAINNGRRPNRAAAQPPPRPSRVPAAKRLGISRGHRFGLLLTLPNILAGGLFVAQRGMFRYLGFVDNGNPPLYPNYMVDHTPYFVKHRVSDKHQ